MEGPYKEIMWVAAHVQSVVPRKALGWKGKGNYHIVLLVLPVADIWEEWSFLVYPGQGYHAPGISHIPGCIDHVGTLLERGQLPVLWDID